jgi:hypothetical protein
LNRHTVKVALSTFAAILAIGAALAYVTAPPKGLDGYRERAAATAESLRSQVETARIWADARIAGRATSAAALVGFEEADNAAIATAAKLEAYEPPDGGLPLRRRFVHLASSVTDALARLRIAAQMERWDELRALSEPLPRLSRELGRFEERAEP